MHPAEVEACLESMVLLLDSRERPTAKLRERLRQTGLPYERVALNVGDYGAKVKLPNGDWFQLPVEIERKMDITELCMCFCQERGRFTREFERARDSRNRLYLLVEGANWENVYAGKYRSRMRSKSLVASILSWVSRYDCQLMFCRDSTTGKLIRDILYYEAREILLSMEEGDSSG